MDVTHVESVGLAVDLERRAGLDRTRDDLLDIDVRAGALVELPTREVPDAVDVRVVDRRQDPLGRALVEGRVERRDDPVELREHVVVHVDGAVGPDVRLDAAEHLERLDALVDGGDLLPLRLHPPLAQVVRVVGEGEEPVTEPLRLERHLLDRPLAVGRPGRVAVHLADEVAHLDERREPSVARRPKLAAVLAELGRDERVAEERVELRLRREVVHLARLDLADSVLRDRQPSPLRLLAEGDVVVLRSREVLEEAAVVLGGDDA